MITKNNTARLNTICGQKSSHFSLFHLLLCFFFVLLQAPTLYGNQSLGHPTLPMLPTTYVEQELDEKWLWSEKLDGIRGEWNGTTMLSKQGNPIQVPPYFLKNFPPFPFQVKFGVEGKLLNKPAVS